MYKALDKLRRIQTYKRLIYRLFFVMLFCGIAYVLVYPLIYIFATSIKSTRDMLDTTTVWVAKNPTLQNFPDAWGYIAYTKSLMNTMSVTVIVTMLNLVVCSVIGYSFARFRFLGKNIIFALIVFTIIVPTQVVGLPQYIYFLNFDVFGILKMLLGGTVNFNNTIAPFVLPAIFGQGLKSGLFIYIFRQFYRSMPLELEEAGYIDGCGTMRTYLRIMLPNAVPAFTTVGLLSFVWHWNDVFNQAQFMSDNPTLSMRLVGIVGYITKSAQVTDLSYVIPTKYAGVALVILPLIFLYLVGQKFFVEGIERSGIVG